MKIDRTLGIGKERMRALAAEVGEALRETRVERASRMAGTCNLYIMATAPLGGTTFVKIGIAANVPARIATVQTGCPIPLELVLHAQMATRAIAAKAEAELHATLREYRSSGEWFCFDTADGSEKQALKDATDRAAREYIGAGARWIVTDLSR